MCMGQDLNAIIQDMHYSKYASKCQPGKSNYAVPSKLLFDVTKLKNKDIALKNVFISVLLDLDLTLPPKQYGEA